MLPSSARTPSLPVVHVYRDLVSAALDQRKLGRLYTFWHLLMQQYIFFLFFQWLRFLRYSYEISPNYVLLKIGSILSLGNLFIRSTILLRLMINLLSYRFLYVTDWVVHTPPLGGIWEFSSLYSPGYRDLGLSSNRKACSSISFELISAMCSCILSHKCKFLFTHFLFVLTC